jgi:hypothetical protein
MNAERQMAAAGNASLQLARTGTLEGLTKHLDAPSLIAAFEMNANLKLEAESAANTELIKQINDYIKTCNAIQDLFNQTIATFDVTKSEEKRGLLGWHAHDNLDNNTAPAKEDKVVDGGVIKVDVSHTDLRRFRIGSKGTDDPLGIDDGVFAPAVTDEQLRVISMFENDLNPNGLKHPIEELFGITRPTFDLINNPFGTLNYYEKNFWDQGSSRLDQIVQQANQQSQLLFNDINTEQKEQTSHFQNATDALAKAQSLINTIMGGIA